MTGLPFCEEMVRAWLEGRKTVTRRLMRSQPIEFSDMPIIEFSDYGHSGPGWYMCDEEYPDEGSIFLAPPYRPGETVYIKEKWAVAKKYDHLPPSKIPQKGRSLIWYSNSTVVGNRGRWRSSRFMPEWAARSHARIVSVRPPERVQEITDDEALIEGFVDIRYAGEERILFKALWDRLYPGSWGRNDWVWPVELEKVD